MTRLICADSGKELINEEVPVGSCTGCGVRHARSRRAVLVAYDGKRCEMFSHKPKGSMNILGTYDSRHDAEKAMKKMSQCQKG